MDYRESGRISLLMCCVHVVLDLKLLNHKRKKCRHVIFSTIYSEKNIPVHVLQILFGYVYIVYMSFD